MIDVVPLPVVRQQRVEELDRLDAPGQPVERRGVHPAARVPGLDAHQRRDHLEVVLDAVLDFGEQDVLLADALLEFLPLFPSERPHLHRRGEPVGGRSVVVLDDVGISIDDDTGGAAFRATARAPE
jgi:hypothetical protein